MKKHSLYLLILLGLLSVTPLSALEIWWLNTSGGSFEEASNWSRGGMVPGINDRAEISTPGTYTIGLGTNHTINQLILGQTHTQSDITFNLGGHKLGATSTTGGLISQASFFVDGGANFTQRVRFTNGVFATAGAVRIGQTAGNNAEVIIGSGAEYQMRGNTRLGNAGNGTLRIQNGGTANAEGASAAIDIGSAAGSNGNLIVSGTGSSLQTAASLGSFLVGSAGTGTLLVTDHATVNALGNIILGRAATGRGTLEISENASLTALRLNVGQAGTAEVLLKSGGTLNTARLDIAAGSLLEVNGGSINVDGNTASIWSEGATYRVFLQNNAPIVQFDRLEVSYTTLDIQLLGDDSFVPQVGNFYSLISYASSYSGLFKDSMGNILNEGDEIRIGDHIFKISYGDGTDGQVGLIHIPEPAHIVSSAAGIMLTLTLVLRRRR